CGMDEPSRPKSALTPGPSPISRPPFPGRGEKGNNSFFRFSPLSRRGRGWEMGEGPGVRARAAAPFLLFLLLFLPCSNLLPPAPLVVGSKNFEESRLLGEIFAQLLESRTNLHVERRLGLAGTQVCFEALKSGAIDVYPEYTGTGLASILGEPAKLGRTQ